MVGAVVGEGSKIGVNATLLPGVKIGKNTFVGPGEIIYEDIKDNIFVLQGKQTKNLVRGEGVDIPQYMANVIDNSYGKKQDLLT